MAKFDYAKMQATAERLLDRFGFEATLIQRTQGGTRMRPGAATETRTAVTVVDDDIRTSLSDTAPLPHEREGGGLSITSTERIVTVSTSAGVAPEIGDTLEFPAGSFTVKNVAPYAPGGVTMFYSVTADG